MAATYSKANPTFNVNIYATTNVAPAAPRKIHGDKSRNHLPGRNKTATTKTAMNQKYQIIDSSMFTPLISTLSPFSRLPTLVKKQIQIIDEHSKLPSVIQIHQKPLACIIQ